VKASEQVRKNSSLVLIPRTCLPGLQAYQVKCIEGGMKGRAFVHDASQGPVGTVVHHSPYVFMHDQTYSTAGFGKGLTKHPSCSRISSYSELPVT